MTKNDEWRDLPWLAIALGAALWIISFGLAVAMLWWAK